MDKYLLRGRLLVGIRLFVIGSLGNERGKTDWKTLRTLERRFQIKSREIRKTVTGKSGNRSCRSSGPRMCIFTVIVHRPFNRTNRVGARGRTLIIIYDKLLL